jgi:predicted nucleic acid-binding protein
MGRISKRIRDRTFDRYMKTISVYFQLVPVTADLITLAAHLTQSYPLKGYDAVQVAAALRLQRTLGQDRALVFVAGDETVITAAQSEGLTVDNPFWHVEENETDRSLHDR